MISIRLPRPALALLTLIPTALTPASAQCSGTSSFSNAWNSPFANEHEVGCLGRSIVIRNPHNYAIRICRVRFKMNRRWCTTTGRLPITARELTSTGAPGTTKVSSQLTITPTTGAIATAPFTAGQLVIDAGKSVHLAIDYDVTNQCRPLFGSGSGIQGPIASSGRAVETWCLTEPISGRFLWVKQTRPIIYSIDYRPFVNALYSSYGQGCNGGTACSGTVLQTRNWGPRLEGRVARTRYAIQIRDSFGYPTRRICAVEILSSAVSATPQNLAFAIHDDTSGQPGQRLASGNTTLRVGLPSIHRLGFTSPPTIGAGRSYWVVFDAPATSMMLPIAPIGSLVRGAEFSGGSWTTNQRSWMIRTYTTRPLSTQAPALNGNLPVIGTQFSIRVQNAPRLAAGQLVFGAQNPSLDLAIFGAPGCMLLSTVSVSLPFRTDTTGHTLLTFPLANSPNLIGARFFSQAAVASNANAMGLLFTNGRAARIGSH